PADIPVVIALHGYGQNEDHMRRFMSPIADLPFIWVYPRGVYPFEMRQPEKTRIGNAWYMYTGDQDDLRDSMLTSTKHILNVREEVIKRYGERPCAVIGFSQGGYLAGVVGANHPECFMAAACVTGRLKHEFMPESNGVKLAQFHGLDDTNVAPELSREAVEATRAKGFEVEHFEIEDTAHEITEAMADELGDWLKKVLA
ncbi:MAG: alpha/beta hydrolase, partial [Planctomycetota bacterium]